MELKLKERCHQCTSRDYVPDRKTEAEIREAIAEWHRTYGYDTEPADEAIEKYWPCDVCGGKEYVLTDEGRTLIDFLREHYHLEPDMFS